MVLEPRELCYDIRRGWLHLGRTCSAKYCVKSSESQSFTMFDASRAMEGCATNFSSPATVILPDLPELYEKCSLQQQDILQRTSAGADCDPLVLAFGETSGVLSSNEDDTSEVGGGFVLDGADDLEALVGYNGEHDTPVADHAKESPYEPTSRRKRLCKELEDEDEVNSKIFHKRQKSEETSSPDVSFNATVSAVTQPPCDGDKFGDEFYVDQSTDELQMLCDDFGFEMPEQQCSSCNLDGGGDCTSSGSARLSRRHKIKETVKLLRETIPGGGCMDTAIVLDEAIHYVKLLQLQVQALGAQRLAQRAGG